jgi:hypothetical protein
MRFPLIAGVDFSDIVETSTNPGLYVGKRAISLVELADTARCDMTE